MTLEALLSSLYAARLQVVVDADGAPRLTGPTEGMTPELKAGCKEHRAHLIRLYRPRAAVAAWRRDGLELGNHQQRAAWCEVAAGLEAEGCCASGADYLAWLDVNGQ